MLAEHPISNFSVKKSRGLTYTNLDVVAGTKTMASNSKAYGDSPSNGFRNPYVEIMEQPKQRGMRFRYECEGRSAGSLPGQSSGGENKSYPTIKIHNHRGPAVIVVSCVTANDAPARAHPHSLVGKDCNKGVCTLKVKDSAQPISFHNIGIQCCKKRDVVASLNDREKIRVDPFQAGFAHGKGSNSTIDLNTVRLCWQVFLPDTTGKFTRIVPPVASHIIYDKKSINELVIVRMSRASGRPKGGEEVFILCDKVNKDDIEVRFYQPSQAAENLIEWEGFGDFTHADVHRQFAIVFRTPAYVTRHIVSPVEVRVELRRKSDGQTSTSLKFTYVPEDSDPYNVSMKRKRKRLAQEHFMEGAGMGEGALVMGGLAGDGRGAAGLGAGAASEEPYAKLPSMVADAGEALLSLPNSGARGAGAVAAKAHRSSFVSTRAQTHDSKQDVELVGGGQGVAAGANMTLSHHNDVSDGSLPEPGGEFGMFSVNPAQEREDAPLFGSIGHLKSCDMEAIVRLINDYQEKIPREGIEYIQTLPYASSLALQPPTSATSGRDSHPSTPERREHQPSSAVSAVESGAAPQQDTAATDQAQGGARVLSQGQM